jgi:hypothetical protein
MLILVGKSKTISLVFGHFNKGKHYTPPPLLFWRALSPSAISALGRSRGHRRRHRRKREASSTRACG